MVKLKVASRLKGRTSTVAGRRRKAAFLKSSNEASTTDDDDDNVTMDDDDDDSDDDVSIMNYHQARTIIAPSTWSPLMDNLVQITKSSAETRTEIDLKIEYVLYFDKKSERLPVFEEICPTSLLHDYDEFCLD